MRIGTSSTKQHKYQSAKKHLFNEKEETTSKPWRMKPHLWKLEYNRIWGNVTLPNGLCLEIIYFDCVLLADYVIDDHEVHQSITDQLPKGLKCYPKEFSRLPYYKQLQILHLFDTMHIGKKYSRDTMEIIGWKAWQRKTCQNV